MTNDYRWATVGGGQIVDPPDAKKTQGINVKEPFAAQYQNFWMNGIGGISGSMRPSYEAGEAIITGEMLRIGADGKAYNLDLSIGSKKIVGNSELGFIPDGIGSAGAIKKHQAIVWLSDDKFILVSREHTSGDLQAVIGTMGEDLTFIWGTNEELNTLSNIMVKAVALSDSLVIVAYSETGGATVQTQALSISGTTITAGSAVTEGTYLNSAAFDIAALDSTHFVVVLPRISSNDVDTTVYSVAGTTITKGTTDTRTGTFTGAAVVAIWSDVFSVIMDTTNDELHEFSWAGTVPTWKRLVTTITYTSGPTFPESLKLLRGVLPGQLLIPANTVGNNLDINVVYDSWEGANDASATLIAGSESDATVILNDVHHVGRTFLDGTGVRENTNYILFGNFLIAVMSGENADGHMAHYFIWDIGTKGKITGIRAGTLFNDGNAANGTYPELAVPPGRKLLVTLYTETDTSLSLHVHPMGEVLDGAIGMALDTVSATANVRVQIRGTVVDPAPITLLPGVEYFLDSTGALSIDAERFYPTDFDSQTALGQINWHKKPVGRAISETALYMYPF